MHAGDLRPVCSGDRSGGLVARVGVPLADVYLEFLGGRCRPNTGAGGVGLDRALADPHGCGDLRFGQIGVIPQHRPGSVDDSTAQVGQRLARVPQPPG